MLYTIVSWFCVLCGDTNIVIIGSSSLYSIVFVITLLCFIWGKNVNVVFTSIKSHDINEKGHKRIKWYSKFSFSNIIIFIHTILVIYNIAIVWHCRVCNILLHFQLCNIHVNSSCMDLVIGHKAIDCVTQDHFSFIVRVKLRSLPKQLLYNGLCQ